MCLKFSKTIPVLCSFKWLRDHQCQVWFFPFEFWSTAINVAQRETKPVRGELCHFGPHMYIVCKRSLLIKCFCKSPQITHCDITNILVIGGQCLTLRQHYGNYLGIFCGLSLRLFEINQMLKARLEKNIFSSVSQHLIQWLQKNKKNKKTRTDRGAWLKILFVNSSALKRTNCTLRLSKRNIFRSKIPSLCTWHADEGPTFQQSGGSLFLPHVHRRASLFCLNLAPTPLRRPEQVEVTGTLAHTHGTDGWTPWPKPLTSDAMHKQ